MASPKKKRANLDKFDPIDQDLIYSHCEPAGVTLDEGVEWIRENYPEWWKETDGISANRLSVWLRKQRVQRSESVRLEEIREDSARATLIGKVFGTALELSDVNVKMIQQAIFQELRKPVEQRDDERLGCYMALAIKADGNRLKERNLDLEAEKFKASVRTKLQAGLDALAEEIKGNGKALSIYQDLRGELEKAA